MSTGGNPLYLGALLTEHAPDELAAAAVLPAPDDLISSPAARLPELPPLAADLEPGLHDAAGTGPTAYRRP